MSRHLLAAVALGFLMLSQASPVSGQSDTVDPTLEEVNDTLLEAVAAKDQEKRANHIMDACDKVVQRLKEPGKLPPGQVDRLGRLYEKIVDKGLIPNMKGLEASGNQEALAHLHGRASKHEEVLTRVLANAPEAAHKGLKRALEVSTRGKTHAAQGAGNAVGKGANPFKDIPPGQGGVAPDRPADKGPGVAPDRPADKGPGVAPGRPAGKGSGVAPGRPAGRGPKA